MNAAIRPVDQDLGTETREQFVSAMSRAVTGVSLVTTDGAAGRYAITVSAVASVSADPPMVLACVNRRSPAASALSANRVFCVNFLAADQAGVADNFAGRPREGQPFDFGCATWREGVTGSPCLEGAVANLDCEIHEAHDVGSHRVYIGRVVCAQQAGGGTPLLYAARRYGRPDHDAPRP